MRQPFTWIEYVAIGLVSVGILAAVAAEAGAGLGLF